jgi:predicted enzyme related to lactoylglutathione lyase
VELAPVVRRSRSTAAACGRDASTATPARSLGGIARPPLHLIEFPADEPDRALAFWGELLGVALEPRTAEQGSGWQAGDGPAFGIHERGSGPGDRFSLAYFEVDDLAAALAAVPRLGGEVIHPGDAWAVCRDSEGTPFGLTERRA